MFAALISTENGNSIAVILLLLVIFKRAKVKRVNRKCSQMLENKQTKKKKPLKSNSIFLPALLIVKSIEQFPFVSNISSSFYHVLVLLLVIKRIKKFHRCVPRTFSRTHWQMERIIQLKNAQNIHYTYLKKPNSLVGGDFNAVAWKTAMCGYGHTFWGANVYCSQCEIVFFFLNGFSRVARFFYFFSCSNKSFLESWFQPLLNKSLSGKIRDNGRENLSWGAFKM